MHSDFMLLWPPAMNYLYYINPLFLCLGVLIVFQELAGEVGIQRSKFKELLSSCDLRETPYDKSQFESDVHKLEAKIDEVS